MTRVAALSLIAALAGVTTALSELRWFRRLPLTERLAPFVSGGGGTAAGAAARSGTGADRSLRGVLGPMATDVGGRLSRTFGVGEDLAVRLERVGSPLTPTQFRTRQLGIALASAAVAGVVALALAPPAAALAPVLAGPPLLAFLVIEQRLQRASARHQQRVFEELPVVAEQLGMFFSAGMSLSGALSRAATRSDGACARDLRRVCARISQGIGPERALREWASAVQTPEVHRLVGILLLHQQTTDLGTLIAAEARSIRRESQRRLLERIERRNEQVWIPVTVATLVPGVIFLSIPFTDALNDFGAL
ncbi:MAG TPA: hypothetical protein DEP66_01710 [Acidimicrobiaceae bacterium]|nr:hypothetical protein [Acidimicrobiaceae bacterium]HCB36955.1 hypothetical protein [Acidimicrobiaceae bacterium]